MNLVKIISSEFDNINRRIVKFLRFGKSDVQTSFQASPPGVDANPIKDMIAVYSSTEEKGKTVIIGFINKNQIAKPGEYRTFSTNDKGDEKTYIYLKDDSTMEIGGSSDNMVRYSELQSAYNQLKSDFDNLVNSYNTHIHVTTATVGATAVPGVLLPTTATETPSSGDISGAKIEEIKTL